MSRPPSTARQEPIVRRQDEVEYETIEVAPGLRKGILLDAEEQGMPHFALRRFTLDGHATVPKHTNEVEHEQYVLDGEYIVGIGEEEYTVCAGDVLYIPAGTAHWYRNERDEPGAFLCAVPNGDDEIELLE